MSSSTELIQIKKYPKKFRKGLGKESTLLTSKKMINPPKAITTNPATNMAVLAPMPVSV